MSDRSKWIVVVVLVLTGIGLKYAIDYRTEYLVEQQRYNHCLATGACRLP